MTANAPVKFAPVMRSSLKVGNVFKLPGDATYYVVTGLLSASGRIFFRKWCDTTDKKQVTTLGPEKITHNRKHAQRCMELSGTLDRQGGTR